MANTCKNTEIHSIFTSTGAGFCPSTVLPNQKRYVSFTLVLLCFTSNRASELLSNRTLSKPTCNSRFLCGWLGSISESSGSCVSSFLTLVIFSRRSNAALFSWIIDLLLLARVQESTQRFFSASQRVSSKKKLPMDTEKLLLIWIYSSTRISKKVPSCSACSSFSRSMSAWPNEICASCNVEGYARNNESAWMQDGCLAFSCFRCCSQFSHPKDLCLPNIQNCWKFHSTWTVATIFPCLGLCSRLQFFLLQLLRNVQRRMYDIHTDWHVIC